MILGVKEIKLFLSLGALVSISIIFLIVFIFFVVVTGVPVCFRILSCVSPGPAAHSFIDFSSRFVLYLCLLAIVQGSFGERCERRAEFILAK